MYHFLTIIDSCSSSDRDSPCAHKRALNRTVLYLQTRIYSKYMCRKLLTGNEVYTYTCVLILSIARLLLHALLTFIKVAFMNYYIVQTSVLHTLGMNLCGPLSA